MYYLVEDKQDFAQNAICYSFFRNTTKRDSQEGYRTLVDSQIVYI